MPKLSYSPLKTNLCIPQKLMNQKRYHLILAISEDKGVEYSEIVEGSMNQYRFMEYLVNLRQRNPFERIALYMDNYRVHKTNLVMEKLEQL